MFYFFPQLRPPSGMGRVDGVLILYHDIENAIYILSEGWYDPVAERSGICRP